MVTVPQMSLPDVTTRAPSISPQQGASDPASFGGASAAGLGALGTATSDLGATGSKIASDFAIQADIRASKDADAQHIGYVTNLGFKGDGTSANPNGFYAMRGEQALAYAPTYLAAIQDQAKQQAATMPQRAADMFTNSAQMRVAQEQNRAAQFVSQQNLEANNASSLARQNQATDAVMNTPNDPNAVDQAASVVRGEVASRMIGQPAEAVAEAQKLAVSKSYKDIVELNLAQGNTSMAIQMFNRYGPQMDAVTRLQVQEKLRGPTLNGVANAAVSAALGQHTSIGDGSAIPPSNIAPATVGRARQVYDGLLARGIDDKYGPGTALGFAANSVQESGGKVNNIGDEGAAHGLFMWRTDEPSGARAIDFQNQHGHLPDKGTMGENLDFVMSELAGKENPAAKAIAAASPDQKAAVVSTAYLRPQQTENEERVRTGHQNALAQAWSLGSGSAAPTPAQMTQTATTVAAQTTVHPDFAGAAEKLQAQFGDDYEMLTRSMSILRRQESIYNLSVKGDQETLRKSFGDQVAKAADGLDNTGFSELAVRRAFDPPIADAMVAKYQEAQQAGQVAKRVQWMTPDDYHAARDVLASTLGAKGAMGTGGKAGVVPGDPTVPGTGEGATVGYAQRQKELTTLDGMWKQRQEHLAADPSAFVSTSPAVSAAVAAIDPKDPATVERAVAASRTAQLALGVDPADVRSIGNAAVGSIVKELHTADPTKEDLGARLDGMSKQYGQAWPGVFHDLVTKGHLDPAYQALASMDLPEQAGGRANLQRALQDKAVRADKFGSAVDPSQKQPLDQGVATYLAPFAQTFRNGGVTTLSSVVEPAVKTLATYYAEQGLDGDSAAKRAVSEIIDSKYETSGSLRAPKTFAGQPLGTNVALAAGNMFLSNLKPEDMAPGGATVAQARRGDWNTNPDGQGMTLMARVNGGYPQVVRGAHGPLSVSFKDAPSLAKGIADPVDPQGLQVP